MKCRRLPIIASGALWSLASVAAPQPAADFYKGKTVYLIVGSDVGGGNDAYNKLIARHIGKYIPGHPAVVAQNMPGAGGLTVMNYVAVAAPKDGTVIGATQESTPFEPLFAGKRSKAGFDPLRLNWIGSANHFASVAFAWRTAPVKRAADLLTHQLLVGESGAASIGAGMSDAYIADNMLGYHYRVVFGYASGNAVDLAIERGELEGRAAAGWQGLNDRHHAWLANGQINILYQLGQEKHPAIPADVPLLQDLVKSEEDRAILDLRYAPYALGYPNFMAAGVPSDRVAVVRKAFAEVLEDPDLRREARQARLEVDPVSPEKLVAVLRSAYAATPNMISRLTSLGQPPADAR